MKSLYIFLFFCVVTITDAAAQLSNDPYQKGKLFDSLRRVYGVKRLAPDSNERIIFEAQLQQQYRKTKDKEMLAFIEVMKFTNRIKGDPEKVDQFADEIQEKYKEFPNIQAISYQLLSYHYFIGNINYEKAFDAYLKLEKLLEVYGPKVIIDYSNYCAEIASAYYKFKNYKKAIVLGKMGVVHAQNKWDFYNTIGLCYTELHNIDSAILYLKKAVTEAEEKKLRDIYRTISIGNIGHGYYLQKKYKAAKPLLQIDLKGALSINDNGLAAGSAIPLADIYLSENNFKVADTLLNGARKRIALSGQLDRLETFFSVRSRYYQLRGENDFALAYRDSTIRAIKRNDSVFNGLLVMRVQQRNDMQKLVEEKDKLKSYKKLSNLRLISVSIIFIIFVIAFFVIRRYRNRIERDKKRIEELNKIIDLRQQLSADMHDDIASTLSSISIYAHSMLLQKQPGEQESTLEKIKNSAQGLQESISDIIWSVNPQMDSMEQVIARMRTFGADMAEYADIQFNFLVDGHMSLQLLDMPVRKNIYLIYKEAINNAVKYSGSKKITVSLKMDDNYFAMEIIDEGSGFDVLAKNLGNGLVNMRRRAGEINGNFSIESDLQKGTTITLIIPFNTNS